MPLPGARLRAWSRWDWPPSHLPGHHLPTLNKGSFAKAQHPLAAGLIPTPGPAAPGRKSGDRSSPPASWPCHQCKNMVTARSTRLDSIVTMLAAYPPRRWPCGPRLWKTRTDARRRLAALSGFPQVRPVDKSAPCPMLCATRPPKGRNRAIAPYC